jgi:hypothetical protein
MFPTVFKTNFIHADMNIWQDSSLLHSVQNGSAAHLASYPMGTGGDVPGGKAAGA